MAERAVTSRSGRARRAGASRAGGRRNVRAAILSATERLVGEIPFGELTVAHICEEAGVSRPTFYMQFDSKLAAVAAVAEANIADIFDELWRPFFAGDSVRSAALMTDHWVRTLNRWEVHREVLVAAGQAVRADPQAPRHWNAIWDRYVAMTRDYIERVRAAGLAPQEFDTSVVAMLVVCMIENALFLRFSSSAPVLPDNERFAQTLTRVWLRAIFGSADPGSDGQVGA